MRLLDGTGDSTDQAAPADRNHDGFEMVDLIQQLEGDCALSRHDERIVEGVDEGHALLFAEARGFGAGFVVVGAVEADLRAKSFGRGDLDERRGERHDDDGAHAALGRVMRDTLRVIAGAGRDDTASGLLGSEGGDAVERTTLFEAAGHLEVFELEEDLLAGHARKHFRDEQGVR